MADQGFHAKRFWQLSGLLFLLILLCSGFVCYQLLSEAQKETRERVHRGSIEYFDNLDQIVGKLSLISRLSVVEASLRYGVSDQLEKLLDQTMVSSRFVNGLIILDSEGNAFATNVLGFSGAYSGAPDLELTLQLKDKSQRIFTERFGEVFYALKEDRSVLYLAKRIVFSDHEYGQAVALFDLTSVLEFVRAEVDLPKGVDLRPHVGVANNNDQWCLFSEDYRPIGVCANHLKVVEVMTAYLSIIAYTLLSLFVGVLIWSVVILVLRDIRKRSEGQAALVDLATQVSHDIRSPVSALDTVSRSSNELPEDLRLLLQQATRRVKQIADGLLEAYSVKRQALECKPHHVIAFLEQTTTEKKLEWSNKPNLELKVDFDVNYDCFAAFDAFALNRVISNILNNAAEATAFESEVQLSVTCDARRAEIKIVDTGCGMAAELIEKIGAVPLSFKSGGAGRGLFHAFQTLKELGGSLEISSEKAKGTTVVLGLKVAKAPPWFAKSLIVEPNDEVVIVDDDPSVHGLWDHLLTSRKRHHFNSPESFLDAVERRQIPSDSVYLIDYQFSNSSITGLQLGENLPKTSKRYLVTSYFEDEEIQEACVRRRMRLIPKQTVRFVPIVFGWAGL